MKAPPSLWEDVFATVRLNQPDLVRGWFQDLELVDLDAGVLTIRTRNGAQQRYLEKHGREAFREAAQATTGRLISVSFQNGGSDDEEEAVAFGLPGDDTSLPLNNQYTFENFITGPCNRLAHAAALAIADEPGRTYNPFFVHGQVGLGKTHLLQAICHAIRDKEPKARLLYLSCETFINHVMECVEQREWNRFRYRYRYVDVLVIDDIQFLAERERSQEEFFHTFNTLHQSRRQIILSADCSPKEIPSLEERLVSRFNSGLVALMDRPCLETRVAILRRKAKLAVIEVPEDVIHFVASHVDANIRDLEGALLRLDALSQTVSGGITMELAREAFNQREVQPITIPMIVEEVARYYDVRLRDVLGKKRNKSLTRPRHICMFLARELTAQSLEEIGMYFSGRDHSTVLHAARSIKESKEKDGDLNRQLDDLTERVKNVAQTPR